MHPPRAPGTRGSLHRTTSSWCHVPERGDAPTDVDATDMRVQDRRVGLVFQSYALFKHMTVAQNIAFGPRVRGFDIDIDARCADPAGSPGQCLGGMAGGTASQNRELVCMV